jgi:hypothetical protein
MNDRAHPTQGIFDDVVEWILHRTGTRRDVAGGYPGLLQENCPDSLDAVIQGFLEFYIQSDGLPVLRINSIWAMRLALKAIQTHRGEGDENLLLSVTPQMLSDAWQLLPNCPNYALASHCQDAIDAQIGLLGPNLPQDLREKMFPLVLELATKELTVHPLTKFNVSLGSKEMYEKVPSGTPGVTQYILKSDISDVAFGLRLLTSLTIALGAEFLEFLEVAERAIPGVTQLFTSHLRVEDVVIPVMNIYCRSSGNSSPKIPVSSMSSGTHPQRYSIPSNTILNSPFCTG